MRRAEVAFAPDNERDLTMRTLITMRNRRLREAAKLLLAGVLGGVLTLIGSSSIAAMRLNVAAEPAAGAATQLRQEMLLSWHSSSATQLRDEMLLTWHPSRGVEVWHPTGAAH